MTILTQLILMLLFDCVSKCGSHHATSQEAGHECPLSYSGAFIGAL